MLTELCQELRNWFDRDQEKLYGTFTISESITDSKGTEITFKNGQYFRIMGSALNDGVYRYPDELSLLAGETFKGSIWAMAVPPAVIALSEQIEAWQRKYGSVDSPALSPYNSESFGGYSYSKGGASAGGGNPSTWQSVFSDALNRWRKI